ncbi:MAG: replicative DNA helicase [Gemmatimonadota bacterium]
MNPPTDTLRTREGRKGGERVPPHSDEAEISVLGGMLLEESAVDRAMELLTEDDFYHPAHRQIFRAVAGLRDQGHMPDAVAVLEELRRRGQLETAGGEEYLARIVEIVPTAANLPYHARLVLDAAVKRRLISAGTDIVAEAFEAPEDADQILNRAEERIFRLSEHRFKKAFTPINQLLQSAVMQLESLSARREAITGAPTGFTDLDELTAGFQLSDLIIVAGRPSLGKTSLALNIAAHAAITANLPVAIFSLEMSTEQLVQRLISTEALVSLKALRTGQATSEQWKRVADACDRLRRAAIYIDDSAILTALEMRAKARRLKQQRDIGLVIVDYLQLMESGSRAESRQQEITEISRSLKALAKELNVPVIALSQLSRAPEQRTDQRPRLADLRESGCLAAGTRVLQPDTGAYVAIESLVGQRGFTVLALNPDTWRLEPAPVRRAFSTGCKPVFRLMTRLGRTIRATANHQFLTIDGWQQLDALTPGMRIAVPRCLPSSSRSTMSASELALLGRLIGDGCTLPRHAIQYTTQDFVMAENVSSLAIEVFGDAIQPRLRRERTWYQVYLSAAEHLTHGRRNPVARWLDDLGVFGLRSHEKRVPDKVFTQPAEGIGEFLRHLWATDGSIRLSPVKGRYQTIYYATSSPQLACDVQSLLLRLEINARRSRVPQRGKGRDQYHVSISGKSDVVQFLAAVGGIGDDRREQSALIAADIAARAANTNRDVIPREVWRQYAIPAMQAQGMTTRQMHAGLATAYCGSTLYRQNLGRERAARLAEVVGSDPLRQLARSDVYWDAIASIEPDGTADVFDLTVDRQHNFVAEDMVVHNSLEQDADLVLFLYRDKPGQGEAADPHGVTEIIVGKNRNGPTGSVKLVFLSDYMRFENHDPHHLP